MEFRVARHTNQLDEIRRFYTTIFEFEILGEFKNHNNYDGVFIGKPHFDWHLEFTTSNDEANHHFDEDDCLVFYPQNQQEYDTIIENLEKFQLKPIKAKNPYWNENGITILDPDGFHIIISPLKITNI